MTLFHICAIISIVGILLCLLQTAAVYALLKRQRRPADLPSQNDLKSLPPISILKPLKGLDDNLFDNLASFCTQDYSEYEVVFALQDRNDPAYKVVAKIKDKYADKKIRIVVEKCNTGLNPKVNNLIPAYRASRHSHILISDSNVMVDKNYLREIAKHTRDSSVGLVSNMIHGTGGRSIGALLENLHLNSFIIGSVSFLDRFLRMPCVIGKSMLMSKTDLEKLGGFGAFKDILAEDYIIGREMARIGKRVVLSNYLITNVNEYWDIKRFLNRHTRWGKLRWKIGGYKYISELLSNPVFISVLPVIFNGPSSTTLSFAGGIGLMKIFTDSLTGKIIAMSAVKKDLHRQSLFTYFLSPVKDLIIGGIWFVPILSSTVAWRGNRYHIGKDSRLMPCPETGIWSWRYRITNVIRERFA